MTPELAGVRVGEFCVAGRFDFKRFRFQALRNMSGRASRSSAALTFGGFMAPQLTLAFLCHDRAPRRRKAKSLEAARHPAPSKTLDDQSTRSRGQGLPSRRMIQQCQHRG